MIPPRSAPECPGGSGAQKQVPDSVAGIIFPNFVIEIMAIFH